MLKQLFTLLVLPVVMYALFISGVNAAPVNASECLPAPALPLTTRATQTVSNADELHRAVANLADNSTLLLRPGTYQLRGTLSVTANNVTIRGLDNPVTPFI